MTRPPVITSPLQHRGTRRIKVECPLNTEVISQIKMDEENGRTGAKPYTTHCVGNGYSQKLVQVALGHEASKPTEIYTHLTRKGFEKLESPLDHLDF